MKISDLQGDIQVVSTPQRNTPSGSSPAPTGFLGKANETLGKFSTGVAKGEVSTLKGAVDLGNRVANQTAGRVVNAIRGKGFTPLSSEQLGNDWSVNPDSQQSQTGNEALKPQGLAENVGFGAERVGEFLLPASKLAKGEAIVNTLSTKVANPLLSATARVAGKSAVQAGAAGAMEMVHTGGGDMGAVKNSALTAGIFRGGMATIGEGARAIKLPERLYSTIFKNTASDMMSELRTENLAQLYKNEPEKYAQFVRQGIIQNTPGGPVLNETIAKQALDAGLRGSIRNMAKTVITGTLDSESAVRSTVKNYTGTVDLSEKQFYNVLKGVQTNYKDVGFNEISNEAGRLAQAIKAGKGNVSGEVALDVRRLLDKARIASSYDKPPMSMSLSQANLKTLADAARSRVNAIPGMQDIMSKYSFNIEAMEALAKEAARRGNTQALSLIDSLFLSSAFGADNMLPGVTAGMARKYFMSGPGVTGVAQAMNNPNLGTVGSTVLQTATSGLQPLLPRQK